MSGPGTTIGAVDEKHPDLGPVERRVRHLADGQVEAIPAFFSACIPLSGTDDGKNGQRRNGCVEPDGDDHATAGPPVGRHRHDRRHAEAGRVADRTERTTHREPTARPSRPRSTSRPRGTRRPQRSAHRGRRHVPARPSSTRRGPSDPQWQRRRPGPSGRRASSCRSAPCRRHRTRTSTSPRRRRSRRASRRRARDGRRRGRRAGSSRPSRARAPTGRRATGRPTATSRR